MNDTGHSPNLLSVEQKQTGHAFNVHLLFFLQQYTRDGVYGRSLHDCTYTIRDPSLTMLKL